MPTSPCSDADGPQASRHDETRVRNERIAHTARTHNWGRDVAVPFICECSDERCDELIRLTLVAYAGIRNACDYIAAPGHQVYLARIVRVRDGVWLYRAG